MKKKSFIILTAIVTLASCNTTKPHDDMYPFTLEGITEAIEESGAFCGFAPETFVYLPYDIDGDGQNEMLIKADDGNEGIYVLNFQDGKANVIAQRETPQYESFMIYRNGYLVHSIEGGYEEYEGNGTEYFKLEDSKVSSIPEEKADPQGEGINLLSLEGWKKFKTDNTSDKEEELGENQTEEGVKTVVESIYKRIFNSLNNDSEDEVVDSTTTVYDYVTDDFNNLLERCEQVETDGPIFPDYDFWLNTQDCNEKLKIKNVEVTDFTPEKATVVVSFMHFGSLTEVYLVMEYNKEKETWLVSDFLDPDTKESLAESMKNYLDTNAEQ